MVTQLCLFSEKHETILDEPTEAVEQEVERPATPSKESWGEVMFYLDGRAYGITDTGRTIDMGAEKVVKSVIADPEGRYNIPAFDQIIELERKLQKEKIENGERTIDAKRTARSTNQRNAKRIRPLRATRRIIRNTGRLTAK